MNPSLSYSFCFSTGFNGIVPLHKVAMRADTSLLELFLSHDADINARNSHGETPLMFAAKRGNIVVICICNRI